MEGIVAHYTLDLGWTSEVRESTMMLSTSVPPVMILTLGTSELAA
jgi:hypothetical protein